MSEANDTVKLSREGARVGRYNQDDYIVMGFDPLMDCLIVKKRRKFSWMKHTKRSTLKAEYVKLGDPPKAAVIGGLEDMGMEFLRDEYADYDTGGRYVVLEICTGLEWAVVDSESNLTVKRVPLDFDEAKRYCDDINQSEKEIWNDQR